MNQTYRQMNAEIGRGIGKEAQMQALMAAQNNNKRTVIDPDRIDTERVMELTRRLTEDTDLGMIVRPLPYADIVGDTEATLNVVMQALGLYTFPTVELTDWLRQEIDDDPELEPHSAIEICAGTGWIWPAKYYPKVTMIRTRDGQRKYRLYEGHCYTEHEAEHIEKYYTHEPQDYDDGDE